MSRRFHGNEFIEIAEGSYYHQGGQMSNDGLYLGEDGMASKPDKSRVGGAQPPADEVKQATDEAAKAAQEAAKVAAEASQSLMKGLSSFGGGLLGGGGGKQQKAGGGLLGGFGFGGGAGTQAQSKTAQKQSKPAATADGKKAQGIGQKPVAVKKVREVTPHDLEMKPYTAKMTARERWLWAFRMLQQVTETPHHLPSSILLHLFSQARHSFSHSYCIRLLSSLYKIHSTFGII